MTLFKILCLSFVCLLSGCATLNSNFECPRKPGVSCKSLREVNQLVDDKQLGVLKDYKTTQPVARLSVLPLQDGQQVSISRLSEQILTIWIAPFTDIVGRYHTQHAVYSIIKPGSWLAEKEVHSDAR